MFPQSLTSISLLLLMQCLYVFTYYDLEGVVARSKRASDEEIEVYMRDTLNDFKKMMKTGFSTLSIPVMDPLKANDSNMEMTQGRVGVKASFTNLLIYGLSTFDITEMKVSLSNLQMTFALNFSNLKVTGLYDMTGTIGRLLSIDNSGNFEAFATDVIVYGIAALMEKSNGYLYIESLNLDMKVDKVEIHFHNSRGDTPLTGPLDAVINMFGKQIFEVVKPRLKERLETRLENTLNSTLASYNLFA